jgi:putative phosphoribosyl transferase
MFKDRLDAGRELAVALHKYRDRAPIVVALPRGGVPVGYEVARALDAPLDVIIARKLGAPGHPELGIGAIAQGGALYLDADLIARLGVSGAYLKRVAQEELGELQRRLRLYRGDRLPLDVAGRTVLLVDDGLATGVTVRAAVRALRAQEPYEIVVAVPVCPAQTARALRAEVDDVVCAVTPDDLYAVGAWYLDFDQTPDEQVLALLARARRDDPGRVSLPPVERP